MFITRTTSAAIRPTALGRNTIFTSNIESRQARRTSEIDYSAQKPELVRLCDLTGTPISLSITWDQNEIGKISDYIEPAETSGNLDHNVNKPEIIRLCDLTGTPIF